MERMRNAPRYDEDAISFLVESLAEVVDEESLEAEDYGGTYMIDTDALRLSFSIDDEENIFIIHNISVSAKGRGQGRAIIEAIHTHADEYNLRVEARQVKDEARGFWEKLGYEESPEAHDTFYRP